MKRVKQRRDMFKFRGLTDKTGSIILHALKSVYEMIRKTCKMRVAVVKFTKDESTD